MEVGHLNKIYKIHTLLVHFNSNSVDAFSNRIGFSPLPTLKFIRYSSDENLDEEAI